MRRVQGCSTEIFKPVPEQSSYEISCVVASGSDSCPVQDPSFCGVTASVEDVPDMPSNVTVVEASFLSLNRRSAQGAHPFLSFELFLSIALYLLYFKFHT